MGKGFAKRKKEMRALQEQMAKAQEQMANVTADGEAGNGLVKVTLNGDYQMTKLSIKPDCVDPDDIEGLEDLIMAAQKDALKNLQKKLPDPSSMMGGGGMPDLSSLMGGMGM